MWWHGVTDWSKSVAAMPASSNTALEKLLDEFEIAKHEVASYLERHFIQLPGFASHLKWREKENGEISILTDYLAIRLFYEQKLSQIAAKRFYKTSDLRLIKTLVQTESTKAEHDPPSDDYAHVWQEAFELTYRNELLSSLKTNSYSNEQSCCQMVFCIDVRSEPIRRELENIGPYATYGFAGFFGMPMRMTELGSALSLDLCPVLLKPDQAVTEIAEANSKLRKTNWQALAISALQLKKRVKCSLTGAFGLVEMMGLWSSIPLLGKTFFPVSLHKGLRHLTNKLSGEVTTKLDTTVFSLEQKVAFAEGTIRGIGLTEFSPVVVLCGHKSSSVNNPYASSLDCGACGGNGGGFSARLAADILNDEEVRTQLASKCINVPDNTIFIAAEHDTTTDLFTFFNLQNLNNEQTEIISNLKEDLSIAGQLNRKKRAATLPQSSIQTFNGPLQRSCDWSQIAPEWGLAGNAAFLAAPRSISKGVDLEGRVFLHSYDFNTDKDNKILELIMTAPMVVAQWINMQYYLSTVDNKVFGSGSKVFHNVIGDYGVMQGAASDLKIGLPQQSIMTTDHLQHEPMRLLVIIRAPLSSVDSVLTKHPEIRQLVTNRWIRLVALDPHSGKYYEAADVATWRTIEFSKDAEKSCEVADVIKTFTNA